jgi:hypothetical protein
MHHPYEEVYRLVQLIRNKYLNRIHYQSEIGSTYPEFDLVPQAEPDFSYNLVYQPWWNVFKERIPDILEFDSWRDDIKNGISSSISYSGSISYKNFQAIGESKYVFELNRLHHLPTYSYHAGKNKDQVGVNKLVSQIQCWSCQNPLYGSVNWTSGIEAGIRVVNLIYSILLFKSMLSQAELKMLNSVVKKHLFFLKRNLSLYSSANNHLVAELMGIIHIAATFSYRDSKKDLKKYSNLLFQEFEKQVDDNGVCREQTIRYHAATFNSYLACFLLLNAKGVRITETQWSKLAYMGHFLEIMPWGDGIDFGDSDDSELLYSQHDINYHLIRSAANSVSILETKTNPNDFRNHLLFSFWGAPQSAININRKEPADYLSSGYFLYNENDITLLVDVGSIGYDTLAAHGHADQLSLLLKYRNTAFIVDCGTFQYHPQFSQWRSYFRGTRSHNTISVNGLDQALSSGPMMWSIKPDVTILNNAPNYVSAVHNGFVKQGVPCYHQRDVTIAANMIAISDKLIDSSIGTSYVWALHFHPEVELDMLEGKLVATRNGIRIEMIGEHMFNCQIVKGSENPLLGWFSESYDCITPTSTLVFSGNTKETNQLTTQIVFA